MALPLVVMLTVLGIGAHSRVQLESDVSHYNGDRSSWVKGARAGRDEKLELTVQIRVDQQGLDDLERIFWDVSDPKSINYGAHRTPEQVGRILDVPNSRVNMVRQYFYDQGVSNIKLSPQRDMLTLSAKIHIFEKALETELYHFSHSVWPSMDIIRSARGYTLPEEIANEVTIVGELLQFPRLRKKSLTKLHASEASWENDCDATACKNHVTPEVLVKAYALSASPVSAKNTMSVSEFQNQYFKHTDIEKFGTSCHRDVTVDVIIGGNKETAGVEAELDIEYIKAVAPEISLTVIYTAQYSLLNWCNKIVSNASSPLVHSVSYGNDEAQQTGRAYILSCNTAFMKAGAQGLSILFASGDQGVCGREGCGVGKIKFHPDFPAASPYITAVGGTDFLGTDIGEETTWRDGGGGFSDNFPIPAFQTDVVAAYKANPDAKLPAQTMWNNTGRGYPDVAALGGEKNPYCVCTNGRFEGVAGTSASSPVVGGIFAKLNGIRISNGKSPLGYLNPFIYQNPTAFNDVTTGRNDAGKSHGFTAVKGWDAATGFGSPNYAALAKLV